MFDRYSLSILIAVWTLLSLTHAAPAVTSNLTLAKRDQDPLFILENAFSTYYYDLSGRDICAPAQQEPNWAVRNGINNHGTACAALYLSDPKINSNRIVALNWTVMNTDLRAFCGKEVEVYKDGQKFQFSEGPLVLWDACERCMCENVVDLSALAFAELAGTKDCSIISRELKVVVTQNQLWEPLLPNAKIGPSDPSQWSPSKIIPPIPLQVTNAAPVYPGRTPGAICRNVKDGMPCAADEQGCHDFVPSGVWVGGGGPAGTNAVPPPAGTSKGGAPAQQTTGVKPQLPDPVPSIKPPIPPPPVPPAPTGQSTPPPIPPSPPSVPPKSAALPAPVPAIPSIGAASGLGKCPQPGAYGCVGVQPAVCNVLGGEYQWIAIGIPCGKCQMLANHAPACV